MEKYMSKEIRAIGVGFSCVDVYEKPDTYGPTGNGAGSFS